MSFDNDEKISLLFKKLVGKPYVRFDKVFQ